MKNSLLVKATKWCAYSHIVQVVRVLIKGGDLSNQTRTGRNIALLGLFCPFFWIALFNGVTGAELAFHAIHSGIVFCIGMVIMMISLRKQKST
ncbi:hypothetical protein [Vibrio intestinalis]|uniref:hypothetical protein n=1 Tax=Vibrio intestinalis TaxID=2933291 RepID=UPI0021A3BCA6|nr:hypothetical protein [Vibrio intestinalis]